MNKFFNFVVTLWATFGIISIVGLFLCIWIFCFGYEPHPYMISTIKASTISAILMIPIVLSCHEINKTQ